MSGLNIVFAASEAAPLAKTGGLADVAGALPAALARLGHAVTVIMPFYRQPVAASQVPVRPLGQSISIWMDGAERIAPLHEATVGPVRFILVEQDDFYDRDGLYGPPGGAWEDNLPRFLFFNRVALEAARSMKRPVDILHCHDWQTGLMPLLLATQYRHHPELAATRSVFTIHNLAYQGVFPAGWIGRLGLPEAGFHFRGYEFYGQINCMKAGIAACDALTTVSQTYAREILTPEYGCGLEGFLADHADKLTGIVNGLDESWNPAADAAIPARYAPGRMAGKARCKAALQSELDLARAEDVPLLVMVSRLAEQKGVDLLLDRAPAWLERGWQLAVLGSGEPAWEAMLARLAEARSRQMHFFRGFNEPLARRFYAGGDIFLMPSRFEPCGLSQLMAMRYGTPPVVRETGGLADTVVSHARSRTSSTGFSFSEPTPEAFDAAVSEAVAVWKRPATWRRIRARAMRRDSSWDASARRYAELYEGLVARA